jgi:hypothetical protein
MAFDLKDYVDVAERVAEFRAKHPEGSLQSEVIRWPEEGFPFVVVKAWAYRDQYDGRPGIGLAQENFPGLTPYTKNSEIQNAETSAWGRAIVAALAADTKRGIASKQEVSRAGAGGRSGSPSRSRAQTKPPAPAASSESSSEVASGAEAEEDAGATGDARPSSASSDAFTVALDAALQNTFGDSVVKRRGFMESQFKRFGVEGIAGLSEEQQVELLEALTNVQKAGAK